MLIGSSTQEFDHLQYIPVIQRMYERNSVDEIKKYASFSQVERFRKELEILSTFGLHKQLEISLDQSSEGKTAARKISDGKVDIILSVSNAKTQETYLDAHHKKRYRWKNKHAFVQSIVCKSNQPLAYGAQNPPSCLNCGAQLSANSENYFCPYCHSHYQAEAYAYRMTRFIIEGAFHDLRYFWMALIPPFILAVLQVRGLLSEQELERVTYGAGTLLAFLVFFALIYGIRTWIQHQRVLKKIKNHDPHFSGEIFTSRLLDALSSHPEYLIPKESHEKAQCGVICQNVTRLQFIRYQRQKDLEIVDCRGKVAALYLKGSPQHVHIRAKRKNVTFRMARAYGSLTPVYYMPDQFTCPNCGSHQLTGHEGRPVCTYCYTELPLEKIDWVLYPTEINSQPNRS